MRWFRSYFRFPAFPGFDVGPVLWLRAEAAGPVTLHSAHNKNKDRVIVGRRKEEEEEGESFRSTKCKFIYSGVRDVIVRMRFVA